MEQRLEIKLREKKDHRYIYVNPVNNTVHLVMPVVGGQTIATDNTCQTLTALNHFFGAQPLASQKSALCELTEYKKELEHDIALIQDGPLKQSKTERLKQIEVYIELVNSVLANPRTRSLGGFHGQYPEPLQALLQRPDRNLFSMRLRPTHIDNFRSTVAPVFTVDLHSSLLHSALQNQFASIASIPVTTPSQQLLQAVIQAVPQQDKLPPFTDTKISRIVRECNQQAKQMGLDMNFGCDTKEVLINLHYFTDYLQTLSANPQQHKVSDFNDIVEGIIQSAAPTLDTQIAASPFHVAHIETHAAKEKLSIITQFFLAQTNIYCIAKSLTQPNVNFGAILDRNSRLSRDIAACVQSSLANNISVEDALLDFIELHAVDFQLAPNTFTQERRREIKHRFSTQYTTIEGSPHFDEFMVLEQTRRGPFTEHQGAICVDFKDLVNQLGIQPHDRNTWATIQSDTFGLNPDGLAILPHQNPQIEAANPRLTATEIKASIQRNLGQAATLDILAEFLLTDVITQSAGAAQKLFQTLDKQTVETIKQSPHWRALRTLVTGKASQASLREFEQKFKCNFNVVLTEQMLHGLYIEAIRCTEPTPELCATFYDQRSRLEAHVLPILKRNYPQLEISGEVKYNSNPPNSLVIECENDATAQRLTRLANDNIGYMYISPQIARALYSEVNEQFGAGWDKVWGQQLDNKDPKNPQKLFRALNLLNIPHQTNNAATPNRNHSFEGFLLKAPIPSIQRLQQLSHSRPQFVVSPELERKLCTYAERRAHNPNALVGFQGEKRLEEALRISGLRGSHIYPHREKDKGYWIQLPPGPNESMALSYIDTTNGLEPCSAEMIGHGSRGQAYYSNEPCFLPLSANDPARSRIPQAPVARAAVTPDSPVRDKINHQIDAIIQSLIIQRQAKKTVEPGDWHVDLKTGWEYGVSKFNGCRSAANDNFSISIKPNGELEVNDKKAGYAIITDPVRLQSIFANFLRPVKQAAVVNCIIEPVRAHHQGKAKPAAINMADVNLNCPQTVLAAFQNLLRGTPILGTTITNPYTGQNITLPQHAEDLTPRHLQILARNESFNTDGRMKTKLYSGLLTDDQIARLRCLVKGTNVAGTTYPNQMGGYPQQSPIQVFQQQPKTIVIDQSGLQWQGDLRNTGGMFFYPNNPNDLRLPQHYANWQKDMFLAMYGSARPANPTGQVLAVTWNGVAGQLALNQIELGIESEFTQALDALVYQANMDPSIEPGRVNFKYLKAGMGFFASGLNLTQQQQTDFEHARLLGIQRALQHLLTLSPQEREQKLGKIGRIELPFSGGKPEHGQTLEAIGRLVRQLRLEWGGVPNEDVYSPRVGFINATTNCGDPHAMVGNEGAHQSVDAAMATNAYLQHLNVAFNQSANIRLTHIQSPMLSNAPVAEAGGGAASAQPAQHPNLTPLQHARLLFQLSQQAPVATRIPDNWRQLCVDNEDFPPIHRAYLLLQNCLQTSVSQQPGSLFPIAQEDSQTIQDFINLITQGETPTLQALSPFLQSYKQEQIRQGRWRANAPLSCLIDLIETNPRLDPDQMSIQPRSGV